MDDKHYVPISTVAVFFFYLRLFYYLRIFRSTSVMVAMIIEIVLDMKFFLVVLLLTTLGFGNTFYVIARNADYFFTGESLPLAFFYSWEQGMG